MISAATSTTVRVVAASSASNNNKVRVLDCIQSRENRIFFLFFLFWINFQSRALAFLPLLVRVGDLFSLSLVSLSFGKEGRRSRSLFSSLSRVEDSLPLALLLFGIEVFDRERENEYVKREERDGVKSLKPYLCENPKLLCSPKTLFFFFVVIK